MKTIIKIHTMLNRIKLYDASSYEEGAVALIITGKNITHSTGDDGAQSGRFAYPMQNIEHYNIFQVTDEFNINLLK